MDGQCAYCNIVNKERICKDPEGKVPKACSSFLYTKALKKAEEIYKDENIKKFAAEVSKQEAACYKAVAPGSDINMPTKPRILEIIEFCHRMDYKKVGLAFCSGLCQEASMAAKIFENNGLELVSVMCKIGGVEKEFLGLIDKEKINPGKFESMCNPIGQALALNEAKTDFNIVMGLCVGHDSLFMKYSDALCTVLAAKDRVMGHNPLAALYTSHSYYRYIKGD